MRQGTNNKQSRPGPAGSAADQKRAEPETHTNTNGAADKNGHEPWRDGAPEANLDSGYAWLILLVMFLLQSSIGGAARCYGLVYSKEVALGYYDREQASWPIATASAVENLAGILSPALVQWLSWRQIELISTSLFVLANLVAYVSDSLVLDVLALGLIQGLALSSCTVLSLLINNDYFERYRTTAYGVSMCGSAFGLLYLGPLVTWLLEARPSDFRLVYLVLAAFFVLNLPLVLLIRPRADAPAQPIVSWLRWSSSSFSATTNVGGGDKRKSLSDWKNNNNKQLTLNAGVRGKGVANAGDNHHHQMLQQQLHLQQSQSLRAAKERSRSRSRLHLAAADRRDSVASISHEERSRRTSVLSHRGARARATTTADGAGPVTGNNNHLRGLQWGRGGRAQLAKSRSGGELAAAGARQFRAAGSPGCAQNACDKLNRETLLKKISLCSMRAPALLELDRGEPDPNGGLNAHRVSRQSSVICMKSPCGSNADMEAGAESEIELDVGSLYRWLALQEQQPQQQQQQNRGLEQQRRIQQQQQNNRCGELGEKHKKQQPQQGLSLRGSLAMLRLPYLHCAWIMLALYYLIARIFVIILVDFAHDHGLDSIRSMSLLNYWSLGELLGRLLLASLIDLRLMSCRTCIALTCLLLAGLMCAMVLLEGYLVYAACTMLVAALISLEYMLINVMMVEYVGKQMVTNCYSLAACISSLILFGRPSMIGFFRDQLGSYDGLLLTLAGLAGSFAILFHLMEPLMVRHWPKPQPPSNTKITTKQTTNNTRRGDQY